jgi:hypothetical protein
MMKRKENEGNQLPNIVPVKWSAIYSKLTMDIEYNTFSWCGSHLCQVILKSFNAWQCYSLETYTLCTFYHFYGHKYLQAMRVTLTLEVGTWVLHTVTVRTRMCISNLSWKWVPSNWKSDLRVSLQHFQFCRVGLSWGVLYLSILEVGTWDLNATCRLHVEDIICYVI